MSFTTRPGTYGARQPGTAVRWLNKVIMRRIVRNGGGKMLGGLDALVLSTLGKKSGERRVCPVCWFPGEEGTWLIVASANGAAKNPAWYLNLRDNPQVTIQIGKEKHDLVARTATDAERAELWPDLVDTYADYDTYAAWTERTIPVVICEPAR